jgi:hypothetical protein
MNRIQAAGLAAAALSLGSGPGLAGASGAQPLVGTFRIASGRYAHGKAGGSYLRMLLPGGSAYFANPDSRAADKSYTLIDPGADGGLATGRFQSSPSPAFDSRGDARVDRIMRPQSFDAIRFSVASLAKNPQTGARNPAPSIAVLDGRLLGQVLAVTAEWNGQYFAQGTRSITGRYNARTHAFLLTWTSPISGGPFNGFAGQWHLKGTFVPG